MGELFAACGEPWQTHAWAEVAIPGGWLGRDYDYVAPLRGVYTGPSEHTLDVTAQMRRSAQQQQQQ